MRKMAVLSLMAFAAIVMVMSSEVEEYELDPFDMVNFDHTNMKMKKSFPPAEEPQQAKGDSQKEEKVPEHSNQSAPKEDGRPEIQSVVQQEEKTELEPPVKQVQKTESVEPCPALSLFRHFVSRLLRFIGDKVSQMDADVPTELCVQLHLTPFQVEKLDSFKQDQSRDAVFNAHDILSEAVQGVHVLNHDDPILRYLWVEKYLGMSLDKVLQVLNVCVAVFFLAVLLPRLRIMWLLLSGFLLSVAMTWYRLYKSEVAAQHSTLMRDLPAACSKMADNNSFWSGIVHYIASQFTFEHDACVIYYEKLIIDPIFRITPMEALTVALVQTMMKPLKTVGTEISVFLRALLKDLPVQWQPVSLLLVGGFVVLVLILTCGYRIRIPFFMSIEPSHSETEVQALKQKISHLQATISGSSQSTPVERKMVPCEAQPGCCCSVTPGEDLLSDSLKVADLRLRQHFSTNLDTRGALVGSKSMEEIRHQHLLSQLYTDFLHVKSLDPATPVGLTPKTSGDGDSRQQQQHLQSPHKPHAYRGGETGSRNTRPATEEPASRQEVRGTLGNEYGGETGTCADDTAVADLQLKNVVLPRSNGIPETDSSLQSCAESKMYPETLGGLCDEIIEVRQ